MDFWPICGSRYKVHLAALYRGFACDLTLKWWSHAHSVPLISREFIFFTTGRRIWLTEMHVRELASREDATMPCHLHLLHLTDKPCRGTSSKSLLPWFTFHSKTPQVFYIHCQINRNTHQKWSWQCLISLLEAYIFLLLQLFKKLMLCFDLTKDEVGGWSEIHMGHFNYLSHTSRYKLPRHPLFFSCVFFFSSLVINHVYPCFSL